MAQVAPAAWAPPGRDVLSPENPEHRVGVRHAVGSLVWGHQRGQTFPVAVLARRGIGRGGRSAVSRYVLNTGRSIYWSTRTATFRSVGIFSDAAGALDRLRLSQTLRWRVRGGPHPHFPPHAHDLLVRRFSYGHRSAARRLPRSSAAGPAARSARP